MKYLIIISLLIISGCNTEKKAIGKVDKAYNDYPVPVAKWVREKLPCIDKKADTVETYKDSVIYIQCPDLPEVIHMAGETDTVYKETIKVKTIKVPVTVPVRVQTITKYIEDSAKIKIMSAAISGLEIDKIKLQSELDNAKEKRNWWRKMCLITWAIIGLTVAARLYFKKPLFSLL